MPPVSEGFSSLRSRITREEASSSFSVRLQRELEKLREQGIIPPHPGLHGQRNATGPSTGAAFRAPHRPSSLLPAVSAPPGESVSNGGHVPETTGENNSREGGCVSLQSMVNVEEVAQTSPTIRALLDNLLYTMPESSISDVINVISFQHDIALDRAKASARIEFETQKRNEIFMLSEQLMGERNRLSQVEHELQALHVRIRNFHETM